MVTSQNGWPIVGKSACDQGPFEGVTFPNGILAGDVATIARWQLRQYEARVEPLVKGTCWGWFVKVIEGSTTKSNHGSGTAWDINAEQHPMGTAASHNMSQREIGECHAIESESHGTLRWGGDFSRPDPMHWEIIGSRTQVAAFAAWIRQQEDDVALSPDDLKAVRLNSALGWYDALWSAANGVDVNGVDYESVGRPIRTNLQKLVGGPVDQAVLLAAIAAEEVDPAPILAGILAVLTPEAIAAAIPDTVATEVADKLAQRLAS